MFRRSGCDTFNILVYDVVDKSRRTLYDVNFGNDHPLSHLNKMSKFRNKCEMQIKKQIPVEIGGLWPLTSIPMVLDACIYINKQDLHLLLSR